MTASAKERGVVLYDIPVDTSEIIDEFASRHSQRLHMASIFTGRTVTYDLACVIIFLRMHLCVCYK